MKRIFFATEKRRLWDLSSRWGPWKLNWARRGLWSFPAVRMVSSRRQQKSFYMLESWEREKARLCWKKWRQVLGKVSRSRRDRRQHGLARVWRRLMNISIGFVTWIGHFIGFQIDLGMFFHQVRQRNCCKFICFWKRKFGWGLRYPVSKIDP